MAGPTETLYSLQSAPTPTLMQTLCAGAPSRQVQWAIRAGGVLFMTALTAAAAQVSFSIPFTQVPFTLQPMVVLMAGLALGPRLGLLSQVLYLVAGVLGAPVFAVSPTLPMGAARLIGPTGGYLMAYPIAALVTGYLAERGFDRRHATSVLAMLAGLIVIYACGVLWLGLFVSTASSGPVGISAALATGFYPFVVADILKVLLAAAVMPALWRLIGR
jgi:biotin transport system substrate-specific component